MSAYSLRPRAFRYALAALITLGANNPARAAASWDLSLDLRALDSDGRTSFLDGGQGKLRFGEDRSGLQLGRLRGSWTQPLGEVFSAYVDASSWGDNDKNPIDLTEAYVEYRPYPSEGFRSRVRLGAFYPPLSLENRATGWQTPYTLTPSAISSWIGEEVRTIGLEGQVDWLGTRTGHDFDLQLTAALFGWNDPAGVMIASHGFALQDRQTTLFGRVGEPGSTVSPAHVLFHEIDNRPGFYVGAQARYLDRVVLNLLHYDNRADPAAFSETLQDFAWETEFDAVGLRVETGNGWTALLQWLGGSTYISPPGVGLLEWDFNSCSAMVAKRVGAHMLAVRYDDFEVDHDPWSDPGTENGDAWTVAYSFDRGESWRFTLEWLRVRSDVSARPVLLTEPALATETKVELAVRYAIGGTL
ncbi:MAG TPA: hypothetical protein VGO53_05600 [Steroidobacteraceae bacterium]|nr:hypothetical protein [Steroidobacteraceae bacterium]